MKEYSLSSISVYFWRKKCCLLRKFAHFACFLSYTRVVKGFRQLSVKPSSANFLTMHHHDDSVFEKLRFRATTLKHSENEGLRFRSLQCGREVKTRRSILDDLLGGKEETTRSLLENFWTINFFRRFHF